MIEVKPSPDNQETLRSLQALGMDLREKAVRSSLTKAGQPVLEAMRATGAGGLPGVVRSLNKYRVSKRGALLLTGLEQTSQYIPKDGEFGLIVGPNKKIGRSSTHGFAAIMEWGARPHDIPSKNNVFVISGRVFRRSKPIRHHGIRGRQWMAKALEQSGEKMADAFYYGLEGWLDKNGR